MSQLDDPRSPRPSSARVLPSPADWKSAVARFQKPSAWRAGWQLLNTLVPYAATWYLMYLCLQVSIWLALPLAVLAGALLIRVFIIFHDCGHDSFFRSRLANDITGFCAGVLVMTPYFHWRWEHALHHATSGDLGRRGTGDIWTMTVQEYLEASRGKRFAYRLARNPFLLFVVAPVYLFVFRERFPVSSAGAREKRSVWWVNLAIAGMVVAMGLVFGFVPYLILMLTAMAVAGISGVWLFYVQHQFEEVYWERGEKWDYTAAALQGSSFYKLPGVLRWFSGNIGYHHVHHLSPRIPNYYLAPCHESAEMFREVQPLGVRKSLKSLRLHLWDESRRRLVSFGEMRRLRRKTAARG
jgi:acyl-lipid omega-6 desaturase (Delta-12 desaturase)